MSESDRNRIVTKRLLRSGAGWEICDEVCRAGPKDPIFEEQHTRLSVCAVLAGAFVYRSTRGRVLMSAGSLLLGECGAGFCCSHEHGTGDRCVAFYFDQPWIENFAANEGLDLGRHRLGGHRIPPVQALVPLFTDIRAMASETHPHAAEELTLRMAGAALRLASAANACVDISPSDERRMAGALKIIDDRVSEDLSVTCLAAGVCMSRYHFLRTFRRVIGETPWRYVTGRRLALAAQYLSTNEHSVLTAALASGFGDLSEFSRRFRSKFGISPAAYRRGRSLPPDSLGPELPGDKRKLIRRLLQGIVEALPSGVALFGVIEQEYGPA